jgi:hypothetical protein
LFALLLVHFFSFVSIVCLVVDSMDQWRERLHATRELFLEDDEEDDFNVNWIIGLGLGDPRGQIPSIVRGSRPGKSPNIDRHRHKMHARMMSDYFADEPVYGPNFFRRRYRMRRSLFLTILDRVCARDDYFVQKLMHMVLWGCHLIRRSHPL